MQAAFPYSRTIIVTMLIVLITILCSLITLFFYFRQVNIKYYNLIDNKTKILQLTQQATKESNAVYIDLMELLIIKNQAVKIKIIKNIDSISWKNDNYYSQLRTLEANGVKSDKFDKLINSRKIYRHTYKKYIEYILLKKDTIALQLMFDELMEKFKTYQSNIENFAADKKNSVDTISTDIHNKVKYYSSLYLFIGILPIIIVILILIYLVIKFLIMYDDIKRRDEIIRGM